jgi:hypothetical protein
MKERCEYFTFICPPIQRKKTTACRNNALRMLKAYKKYKQITPMQYDTVRESIINAPHDDAISSIMCRLRHNINW